MGETATFRNEDLVLRITPNIDPAVFDVARYDDFLDALCSTRDFQKDAIRQTLSYLLGGAYGSLRDLAAENYDRNPHLQEKYGRPDRFEEALQLPGQLACSIDHATGTGKSYVMYGLARIMLAAGAVDHVLVLCPSNTIEAGLLDKFRGLSRDRGLKELLPPDSVVANPHIIDATETITTGAICVENIHATYAASRSAIRDSLKGKGKLTLVLNDEAHHIYSPSDAGLRKWKEFLLDPDFGFRYIVGLSGTCYIGNEYFTDVIARYSLHQAMEDGAVKQIEYVGEDAAGDQIEQFQKMYANHRENATKRFRKVRPLTILVTKDISRCRTLTDELVGFLAKAENLSKADATRKVLCVTSANEHRRNVDRLRAGEPDDKGSAIEWITSVSMLTEGWDVHNVFQIVPHEERAFNSKLLIAQVLGRGLRLPLVYRNTRPQVIVFNHARWAGSIKHLVDEVTEDEKRIFSFPVKKPKDYSFTLHQINYRKTEKVTEVKQDREYNFENIPRLATQQDELPRETTYVDALSGERRTKKTRIRLDMVALKKAANDVHNRLKSYDMDNHTAYAKRYPAAEIERRMRVGLERVSYTGEKISRENLQRVYQAFGVAKRKGTKNLRLILTPLAVETLSTLDRPRDSIGLGALRREDHTVFLDGLSLPALAAEGEGGLAEAQRMYDDNKLLSVALHTIPNQYEFRTCLCLVITNRKPERAFVRHLVKPENAAVVDGWIKNHDSQFYSIEFSWKKGHHNRRGQFNPDFFIKKGKDIIVVEIKDDSEKDDPSPENKGKRRWADRHFKCLNRLQGEARYYLTFLSPRDYDLFFERLRTGDYAGFTSSLDAALSS